MIMNSNQYRRVIFHLAAQGHKPKFILEELTRTYGDAAPSKATVARWVNEFKWGRREGQDLRPTGRPPEAITQARVDAARLAVARDPKASLRSLASELGLARETTKNLLQVHLGLRKVLARWVPHALSEAQKAVRAQHGRDFLAAWDHRWSRFRSRVVTVDETWVSYKTPLTRQSAGEWQAAGSAPPELPRLSDDRRKLMAIVFWDCEGLVHLEWFRSTKERPGLTGELYEAVLDRLHQSLVERRPQKIRRGVLLLQDNAPCHKTAGVSRKLSSLGFKTVAHPPYSPDLAPSDFYLFRVLKNHLRGHQFDDDEALKAEVSNFFVSKESAFYFQGIDALRAKLEAVVESAGEYLQE